MAGRAAVMVMVMVIIIIIIIIIITEATVGRGETNIIDHHIS